MRKLVIVCNGAISSSMAAKKMNEAEVKRGVDIEIDAYSFLDVDKLGYGEIILISPQIRHKIKFIQSKYPDKPTLVLSMRAFGLYDGEKLLDEVVEFLAKQ